MKKKLLLLVDGETDQTFIGKEAEKLCSIYDVTAISCTPLNGIWTLNIPIYYAKTEDSIINIIKCFFISLFDKMMHEEIKDIIHEHVNFIKQYLRSLRFYATSKMYYKNASKYIHDGADIIYSYWFYACCFAFINNYKNPNTKIVTRTHGYDLYDYYGRQPFKMVMDKRIDKVIFIGDDGKRYYLRKYGLNDSDKYPISYVGITNSYKPKVYVKDKVFRIVSCSYMVKLKRIHLIIEALSNIDDINIKWTHIGSGDLNNELKAAAEKILSLKENISYTFTGQLCNEEVMAYYDSHTFDSFIMLSETEGQPVSIMEAMSFGIPIIATGVGNIPYMIDNNGILLSENPSIKEIADAIRELACMSEMELQRYRTKSYNIWRSRYVSEINAARFISDVLGYEEV